VNCVACLGKPWSRLHISAEDNPPTNARPSSMMPMRSPNSPPSLAPALHKNRQHFAERDLGICSRYCARAASGHATAALPSAASNSRRPMVTVMRPSRARVRMRKCNDTTPRARCPNCVAPGAGGAARGAPASTDRRLSRVVCFAPESGSRSALLRCRRMGWTGRAPALPAHRVSVGLSKSTRSAPPCPTR
jgi:hypothetical protein